MSELWRAELNVACEAVREAGRVTLGWFRAGVEPERKADGSPVTIADRESEAVMRGILGRRFPDDGILGEEEGEEHGSSGRRWILDPIDGTRSFVHGVPLYGVMAALEVHGEPVVGVLHFPALGETIEAARGIGCRWNDHPCHVSDTARIEDALIVTSGDAHPQPAVASQAAVASPADVGGGADDGGANRRATALQRLGARAESFRTWGDCYGYALVATGRADAMLDPILSVWDAAAVRPVIEEAGGVFTDWTGAPTHTAGHAIGTNAALAEAIRDAVR
jgi:histidinol phosphatase-like enzyme (inositol monophosphatase family)